MTIRNGLFFENNKTGQHAQDVRLMLKALLGGTTGATTGVGGGTHLKVTEKAGTPDMSVDVAPGHFFIEGSRNSAQGVYHGYNDATINVPLSASDPTNPRIDIIYIRAEDSQYDAGFDTLDMFSQPRVAEGTPAAVPAPPTITDEDYIELARVTVGAGVSAITTGDITDTRVASSVWTRPRGQVGYVQVTSNQSGIVATLVDLNGLSLSFDAVEGRIYLVTAQVLMQTAVATAVARMSIVNPNTILAQALVHLGPAGLPAVAACSRRLTSASGAVELKLRADRLSGSGNITMVADPTAPAFILVEDIGGFLL